MFINKKAAFYTLVYKLNFSETSSISRQLSEIDFIKTNFNDFADILLILVKLQKMPIKNAKLLLKN